MLLSNILGNIDANKLVLSLSKLKLEVTLPEQWSLTALRGVSPCCGERLDYFLLSVLLPDRRQCVDCGK